MDQVDKYFDETWKCAAKHKEVTIGLAAVGALWLTGKALGKLCSLFKYTLRPSFDLQARYGDGWAIVTGASDGIGKAYALELARRGFKVGLIARNQTKLDAVAAEIRGTYGVQTKTVVFDFNTYYTEEKVNELKDKLSEFDEVSILVNNVGILHNRVFAEHPQQDMLSLINVNVVALTIITKLVIPKLLLNENRGGIINIGSGTTRNIYPGMNVYSSTKAYVTMLSESIAEEYKDKLDVLVATVGPTKTNMNRGVMCLSSYPESVAKHTLDTLGWETHTYGDFRHGLRVYFLNHRLSHSIIRYIDR